MIDLKIHAYLVSKKPVEGRLKIDACEDVDLSLFDDKIRLHKLLLKGNHYLDKYLTEHNASIEVRYQVHLDFLALMGLIEAQNIEELSCYSEDYGDYMLHLSDHKWQFIWAPGS